MRVECPYLALTRCAMRDALVMLELWVLADQDDRSLGFMGLQRIMRSTLLEGHLVKSPDPAAVVQRQLDAYNSKNIDVFVATYAPEAEQFVLNGEMIAKGIEDIRQRMLVRFAEPDLYAKLVSRMVMGHTVVDLERITRNFPEGRGVVEMICVYEVIEDHIVKASFATGEKVLEQ